MTRREEVLRLIELKRQAIKLIDEVAEEHINRLVLAGKGHRADIQSLNMELKEIDYADQQAAAA